MKKWIRRAGVILTAAAAMTPASGQDTIDGSCTVSVLNQTAYVQTDGTWNLPNVPANMGPVRARLNCVEDGVTLSGSSDFFTIVANRMNAIPKIELGTGAPTPESITLSLDPATLTEAGQTVQATVTALFPDATTRDVTASTEGTVYASTNPAVASVDADGLVTAQASGRVLITALHDAILDSIAVTVLLGGDSDGDGLPDDYELANGLDPNDPVDALEDPDGDGLVNLEEFNQGTDLDNADTDGDGLADGNEVAVTGTSPVLFDTDGDGFSDGLEIETGSDPLDPSSFNLAEAPLSSFEVTPPSVVLIVDALTLDASQQLTVTGTLRDGTAIDLTSRARGTSYSSSDLLVCNFGAEDGVVFAGQDGSCTATVTNSGFADMVDVEVSTFFPIARGTLELPGFANNVDVSGDHAFVASGAAGLLVVDVGERSSPALVASLDTAGNANDVMVEGGRAYVADGAAGLLVVDVTDPLAPTLLGTLDTPGDASDVALFGDLVLVADGPGGVQVVDARAQATPVLLASVATPGVAKGVDVDEARGLAAVADGTGLRAIDLSQPASPVLVGSVATDDARDVAVAGGAAWLADFTGGLRSVDLSDPAAPQIAASVPLELGGIPTDVALTLGSPPFALTSEVFFATASVPIVEVSDPANPLPRFVLDFGVDLNGTGLAVDDNFVYLTAAAGFGENGSTGTSRLLIGQYLGFRDDAGVSPTIELVSPLPGTEVVEGEPLVIEAEASDDVGVFAVRFTVDGEVVFEDRNPLYTLQLPAPAAPAVLTIGAHVLDFAGNRADAEPVEVQVVAPAETSVIGSVADVAGTAVEGAAVTTNLGGEGTTDGGGFFRLDGIPADQGEVVASATAERGGVKLRGRSAAVAPVAGGFTDVGEIRMAPLGDLYPGRKFMFFPPDMPDERAPGWLARGDFNGDRVTDWAGSGGVLGREIGVLHGKGDGTFEPARTVAAELRITNLEAADLNGDGLSDLVAVHAGFDEISVLPSPDFEPSRLPVGDLPSVVAISDLDLDGHPDLVVVNRFSFDLSLLFGLGGGAFAPEVRLPLEDSPEGVIATDLDGGGAPDLVVISSGTDIEVFHGRGDGTFEVPVSLFIGIESRVGAFVDATGDGRRDLVFHGSHPTFSSNLLIAVVPGLGDGTFGEPVVSAGGEDFFDFQVRDVDLDGWPDLALIREISDFHVVTVRPGDGSGFFGAGTHNFLGEVRRIHLEDADGDGFPDLLVGGGGGLKVFRGTGSTTFSSFGRHEVVGVSSKGRLVVAGDLDGDGVTDLVQTGFEIIVHLGRSAGGYEAPATFPVVHSGSGLWLADVNRDGRPDVVSRSLDGIAVLPGFGDGTFGEPLVSAVPRELSRFDTGALLGDFDGDGLDDFVAVEGGSSRDELIYMTNRGDGTFALAQIVPASGGPQRLAAADFDGDGRLDLAVTHVSSRELSVLLNQGGTFGAEIRRPLELKPTALVAFDADRDGRPDLVVGLRFPGQLRIFFGRGDGTFDEGGTVLTDPFLRHLRAADVDGDGLEDLLVANSTDDVAIYPGRGDGTFGAARSYTTGTDPRATHGWSVLVPTDLNGDARLDLVVRGGQSLHFLIQEGD